MVWCESIIATAAPAAAGDFVGVVVAPTSLTTRTGRGKPKVTHAMALCVNDNINDCYVLPAGYSDPNGFPIECTSIYGAVNGFDMEEAVLSSPVELPENCLLALHMVQETAAASQTFIWLMLEYPGAGPFAEVTKSKPLVRRVWEHGAALVSNAVADSTAIADLQPGRTYQIAAIGNAAINGATAGCVGPAFFGLAANHTEGAQWFIPLQNAGNYQVGGGPSYVDFARCKLKSPIFAGGQPLATRCVGFTAEQPQAQIALAVDKVFPG